MRRLLSFLILYGILATPVTAQGPTPVPAEEGVRWLKLEIIVFKRRLAALAVFDEVWAHQPLEVADSVDASDPTALWTRGILDLGPEYFSLTHVAREMERSAAYRILTTRTLALAPQSANLAPRLRLRNNRALSLNEPPTFDTAAFDWTAPLEAEFNTEAPPVTIDQLDGTIHVYRERFFHLSLDLNLIEPLAGLPPPFADLDGRLRYDRNNVHSYRIRVDRRLRVDELHYFDHPRFGVIARLSWAPRSDLPELKPPAGLASPESAPMSDPPLQPAEVDTL